MSRAPFTPPFRAAVFDLDGTLIDGYRGVRDGLNPVLAHYGLPPITVEGTKRMVGEGLPALMENFVGPERAAEAVRLFREVYPAAALAGTDPMPGAEALLRDLARAGIPAAIASNKPVEFCRLLVEKLGFAAFLVAVAAPGEGLPPKPDPAMVHGVLPLLGGEAGRVLFVGDMPVDVATARAAGMPVAVLPTGSSTREELEAAGPDRIVDSLEALRPFFGI